jgi:hypothetical protein
MPVGFFYLDLILALALVVGTCDGDDKLALALVVGTCDGDDKEQSQFPSIVVGSSLMLPTIVETWVLVD